MRISLLFISVLLLFPVLGQEVKATLSVHPNEVQENETFEISIEANTDGKVNLNLPEAIEVLSSHRSISSSSSFTVIINGKVQQSSSDRTINYSFTCRIAKSGAYPIANATFQAQNKQISLNNVTVQVRNAPPVSNSIKSNINKNFFGLINSSKNKVYVGEPVIISSKIYSRARITDIAEYEPSKISGTVHKTNLLKNKQNLSAKNERIQGVPFQTVEISREVLIPQKAGKISCSPFQIKIGYQSSFFFSDYTNVRSGLTAIHVMPLPQNAPNSFHGAVGKYALKTSISESNLKEGEAFTYTLTVSGSGNLHLLSIPELTLPESFEMYGDPKVQDNYTITSKGGEGSIKYEYIIRVTEKGKFNIHPFEFAYFDLRKERYIEIPVESYTLKVEKGDHAIASIGSNVEKKVKIKNEGIKYIVNKNANSSSYFLWEMCLYWVVVLIPFVVAIPVGLWIKKRLTKKESILVNQRYKKAKKLAAKKLSLANQLLEKGNIKAFNDEVYAVFTGFLAQKMKCATSELTREAIVLKFASTQIDKNLSDELINVWDELELVKYGISGTASPQSLLEKTSIVIDKIDAQWK